MKTVAANLTTLQFVPTVGTAATESVVVLKTREDIEKLETKQILGLFNSVRETQIKKFDSRAVGIERLTKLIDAEPKIPEMAVEVAEPVAKVEAAPTVETETKTKRVRTEEPAVDRIIKYGHDNKVFTLEQAEKDLGIKKTCMRTHMSFINSNGVRFGEVKFVGNRKEKTYTMKVPTRPVPTASKAQ